MPRTAAGVDDFKTLLPIGTPVYIAHIEGTPIEDMIATARRLARDGFPVMPHFPARLIADKVMLEDWIARYRGEAGVDRALLLAGGRSAPAGAFQSSMQMMETGLFDKYGFTRLHVAGHPEGNRDIDPDGSTANVDAAIRWKQQFAERSDAEMAIVTQFAFEARPVLDWIAGLREAGVHLPVHVGIAGPAKLQTLIRFAIACGVGSSLKVLQRRAVDVTKLMLPYEPADVLSDFARAASRDETPAIAQVHFFPLGGIRACAEWAARHVVSERGQIAAGGRPSPSAASGR
ncbi:methylenetetrahydrofolate reductase [Martelella soudanensis]|uniref:methylenetetrahydrofolate reductase n=2 Tax=unclassified Martelella TaxID=2629616 RepID=UPI001AEE1A84|nr:methylenetetrahydrofolate reductase [Martelella sp. NC20]